MIRVDDVIAFENGESTEEQEHRLFNDLLHEASVYELDGMYREEAEKLTADGYIEDIYRI